MIEFACFAPVSYRFPLVFIGEDNPHSLDPRMALYHQPLHASGDRLCRLICRMRVNTYHRFPRLNLCSHTWSMKEARRTAELVRSQALPGIQFVLLGRKVASAFGVDYPFIQQDNFLTIPHPSARNRLWTSETLDLAHEALKQFAPQFPWGDREQ